MSMQKSAKVAICLLSVCLGLQFSLPAFSEDSAADKEGIVGLKLDPASATFTVLEVMENTPSAKAGLLKGDEVFEVDGVKTSNLKFADVINKVRGTAGSKVKVIVMRAGKPIEFNMVRVQDAPRGWFRDTGSSQMGFSRRRDVSELPPATTKQPGEMKPDAIHWEPDLRTALLAAKETKKRVFLVLTAKG